MKKKLIEMKMKTVFKGAELKDKTKELLNAKDKGESTVVMQVILIGLGVIALVAIFALCKTWWTSISTKGNDLMTQTFS